MSEKDEKKLDQRIYSNIAKTLFVMAKMHIMSVARNEINLYKNSSLASSNKKNLKARISIQIRNDYVSPEIVLDNDNEMAIMGAIVRDYDDYSILYNEIKKLCVRENINIGDIVTKIKNNSTDINIWIEI